MSQKKVDAYKEQKANRKEIMKKEKRMLLIEKIIGLVVCIAAVCWVGYSVYDKVTDTSGVEVVKKDTVIDTSALDDYTSGLQADDEEEFEVEADETEEETDDTEEESAETDSADTESEEAETVDEEADDAE